MTVSLRKATVHAVDFTERTIEVVAAPYNEVTRGPVDNSRERELIEPGAFRDMLHGEHHVTVNREHDRARTVGKVVGYRDTGRGLVAVIRVSNTALGDETLQLANDGVLRASVGMVVRKFGRAARDGVRRVQEALLDHLALVASPAYLGSKVLSVRGQQWPPEPERPSYPSPFDQLRL